MKGLFNNDIKEILDFMHFQNGWKNHLMVCVLVSSEVFYFKEVDENGS